MHVHITPKQEGKKIVFFFNITIRKMWKGCYFVRHTVKNTWTIACCGCPTDCLFWVLCDHYCSGSILEVHTLAWCLHCKGSVPLNLEWLWNQWWRKLKHFEGDGMKKFGLRGVTLLKTHQFWHICLLPIDNSAIFLVFSFLYFCFSLLFFFLLRILQGDVPLTENFRGTCPPSPRFCRLCVEQSTSTNTLQLLQIEVPE